MNSWWHGLLDAGVERWGWTLVHSLWQGAVAAGVFAVLRPAFRPQSARIRYWVACGMLGAIAAGLVLTFLTCPGTEAGHSGAPGWMRSFPHLGISAAVGRLGHRLGSVPELARRVSALGGRLDPALPWIVGLWFLGVLGFMARWAQGCRWLRKIKTREVAPLADPAWIATLERLKLRLGVSRPVRLLRSGLAEVPMVTGWLRPMILFPASTLSGLSPAQLEAILAHELAHVRHYDCLVNTLQNLLETVMFYHPAVWWISRCAREEREHCCDELALHVCRDPVGYARALLRLEELRGAPARLAFTASGGSLLQRIRRVLAGAPRVWPVTPREFGGLAFLALGCVLLLSGGAMLLLRPEFRARCLVRLDDRGLGWSLGVAGRSQAPDPATMQTELAVIETAIVLDPVIQTLNLQTKWSGGNGPLLPTDARAKLREHLQVNNLPGTTLFAIQVSDEDPAQAAGLANAIAQIYQQLRNREFARLGERELQTLAQRVSAQESKVRAAQEKVDALRANLNVPPGLDAEGGAGRARSSETLRRLEGLRIENRAECARLEVLLAKLKMLEPDILAQALPSSGLADSLLTSLLEQLNLVEQKMTTLTKEYGPEYPELKKTASQLKDLREKVRERTAGILLGLETRVASMKVSLDELETEVARTAEQDRLKDRQLQPYWDAIRDLRQQEQVRQALYVKLGTTCVSPETLWPPSVDVVEAAVPDPHPQALNRRRGGAMALSGVLLCALGVLMLRFHVGDSL